jgi:hypothetical protein
MSVPLLLMDRAMTRGMGRLYAAPRRKEIVRRNRDGAFT